MEQHSEHPIARAVLDYAESHHFLPAPADDFQVIQGKGARATFDGREFWLGSHRYLEQRGQETPAVHDRIETMSGQGRTVVVVGNESHVCGLIALADEVRPASAAALAELRRAGIEHLVMLTGDNRPTAEAIAAKSGVDEVLADLLPEDKVTAIESLVARYGHVAMIGDGVNDAPALARATVGIAMGAAGTDAAIETADVALMSDDLSRLPWLIRHSRRVLGIVRQNIAFSLAVKLAFVILTFAGISSLWGAIAADMGASLLVIANGLRLLR
jgi:Zn2+/Cd2+-exporting ATPase